MSGSVGVITPAELRATQGRIFAQELAAWCRINANNLAWSIVMAKSRGEQPDAAEAKMEVVLDYEQALQKRVHGREMPRYVPTYPQQPGEEAA